MLTKPRKYPFPAPPGEYSTTCDYCGCEWYRSDLRRDASGFLACPDDQDGRDTVTLQRLETEAISKALEDLKRVRRERW